MYLIKHFLHNGVTTFIMWVKVKEACSFVSRLSFEDSRSWLIYSLDKQGDDHELQPRICGRVIMLLDEECITSANNSFSLMTTQGHLLVLL